MKIGTPVYETPAGQRDSNSRYSDIYRSVRRIRDKAWLPVKFSSASEALNFRVAATTHRSLALEARLRGSTVYVRMKRGEKK